MSEQASLLLTPKSDRFPSYPLPGLLPEGALLVYNPTLGTLVFLAYDHEQKLPRLLGEQQFTPGEAGLLRPLLACYPDYCAYEVLHASFYCPPDSPLLDLRDPVVMRSRKHLETRRKQGRLDEEMRPVRNVLSRVRLKLHELSIDVKSILDTGCLLMPYAAHPRSCKEDPADA
jgi:hypothetical protein